MTPFARVQRSLGHAALIAALTLLVACRVEDPPVEAADRAAPQPAAIERVAPVGPEASAGLPAAPPVEAAPDDAFAAEHARRLEAAQAYLDRARSDAEERHRRSLLSCQDDAADFDTCVATADESLQAEMRAARVEFDAQMMQPN
jgi:hypothetical protein